MKQAPKILPLVNYGALFLFVLACAALAFQLRSPSMPVPALRSPASISLSQP